MQHEDIGQMNMYLNYFRAEQNVEGDTAPIGIVLCADKHEILVEYALGGISNQLFGSKYQFYFPDTQELQRQLEVVMEREENQGASFIALLASSPDTTQE